MQKWILYALIALNASNSAAEGRLAGENLYNLNASDSDTSTDSDISGPDESADFVPSAEEDEMRVNGVDPEEPRLIRINNSRLFVYVNKTTQRIEVYVDGRPMALPYDKVSTGGTLKIPNNADQGKAPYCGSTPDFHDLYIPAIAFPGGGDKYKATVFEKYFSSTFLDDKDRPIAMPHAIRIRGGIFFHAAAPAKIPNLGTNVSGDCVRLHPATAKILHDLVLQYGGLTTTIEGADPKAKGLTCTYMNGRAVEVNSKTGKITKDPLGNGQLVGSYHPEFANREKLRKNKKASSAKTAEETQTIRPSTDPAPAPRTRNCGPGPLSGFCL